jgi:hypothetical protein
LWPSDLEIVMAVDNDTAVLPVRPVDGLPPVGDYRLRLDRCVAEVSVRLLGRPLVRARVRASGGTLVVGEPTTLTIDLRAGARRLRVPDRIDVTFAGPGTFDGLVRVRGEEHPLVLKVRSVHADEDTAVLAASGALPGGTHLVLAAEFTR